MLSAAAQAADLALATDEKAAPDGVSEEIAAVLQGQAVQLKDGDASVFEFWPRGEVPLKDAPEKPRRAMRSIAEGTLLGVVAVHEERRDYRDDAIQPGVYTMRFALQPEDGDHLGTSIYPYFALLVPVDRDKALDGIEGHDATSEASATGTATEHPRTISLRPGDGEQGAEPKLTEPADDHKAVEITVAGAAPEGEAIALSMEIIYEGVGEL